jgi:hypothetical protein
MKDKKLSWSLFFYVVYALDRRKSRKKMSGLPASGISFQGGAFRIRDTGVNSCGPWWWNVMEYTQETIMCYKRCEPATCEAAVAEHRQWAAGRAWMTCGPPCCFQDILRETFRISRMAITLNRLRLSHLSPVHSKGSRQKIASNGPCRANGCSCTKSYILWVECSSSLVMSVVRFALDDCFAPSCGTLHDPPRASRRPPIAGSVFLHSLVAQLAPHIAQATILFTLKRLSECESGVYRHISSNRTHALLVLRFLLLEFSVQLRFSGMSRVECWKLYNISANIVVAIFRVSNGLAFL